MVDYDRNLLCHIGDFWVRVETKNTSASGDGDLREFDGTFYLRG